MKIDPTNIDHVDPFVTRYNARVRSRLQRLKREYAPDTDPAHIPAELPISHFVGDPTYRRIA